MIETSARYKEFVYSADYARHFLPEIILKVIDTAARDLGSYSVNTEAFYSKLSQLVDENFNGTFTFGTLEDFQFLLNGTKNIMRRDITGQFGYCAEFMSNKDGVFDTPVVLTCKYSNKVTMIGRTLIFDTNYDSVPAHIKLEYYSTGLLIHTNEITDNTSYIVTIADGVDAYDEVIISFYSTTHPFRRIHLVEDIPGIYFSYGENEVVSVDVNQSISIFSNEILAGEVIFQVENAKKTLDILNPEGFEKYLRQRQPVEINFVMVFPDNSIERVPIGLLTLTEWKSQKGALTAQFTARDGIASLSMTEYIKGTFPKTPISLYEYAEQVILDAGIEDYKIDSEFRNIYTTAPLPIGYHKELLRLIAQAGQGVVVPTTGGGVHVRFISPLVVSINQVKNPAFDNNFTNWTQTGFTLTSKYIYTSKQSALSSTGELKQTIDVIEGNKYFIRLFVYTDTAISAGSFIVYANNTAISANLANANLRVNDWNTIAAVWEADSTSLALRIECENCALYVDAFQALNLTTMYGIGNEPDVNWCVQNIRYFDSSLSVPGRRQTAAVDELTYGIIFDAPEITTIEPVASVETNIYSYDTEAEVSEIYKGQRYVSGTETFNIKFSKPAKDYTIKLSYVDAGASGTPTLVDSKQYAQAAELRVTAVGNVQILVEGKAVMVDTSTLKVDSSMDKSLLATAKGQTIDNKLITSKSVAEDVTAFAIYWYNGRYSYNFDWRQNPAIQLYDPVIVHDDFERNNTVLITERNIDYNDGVLSGSSRGVC